VILVILVILHHATVDEVTKIGHGLEQLPFNPGRLHLHLFNHLFSHLHLHSSHLQ
jgi:hypothetical protein